MRIRKKARKWVLNLWTIALTVLSATGLNPFDGLSPMIEPASIVRETDVWSTVPPGLEQDCVLQSRDLGAVHLRALSRRG